MILILSVSLEFSTDDVIEWLKYYGADYHRVNYLIKNPNNKFCFSINDSGLNLRINGTNKSFDLHDIGAVWYRRFSHYNPVNLDMIKHAGVKRGLNTIHNGENSTLLKSFYALLKDKYWLSNPETGSVNKIDVLNEARKIGIKVPPTIITSNLQDVIEFITIHDEIITKPIKDVTFFTVSNVLYTPFTRVLTKASLDNLPEQIYPSLFQKYIRKKIEIRTVFIDGKFFSMAMMTQRDGNAKIDFRALDVRRPFRQTPYKLPTELEKQLFTLMGRLHLNTGSIDLILSADDDFYFLEVNPVGQFGMTSEPCNYHLEKEIAQLLIKKDHEFKGKQTCKNTFSTTG